MPRPNTKPMTREERIALYQMLHGENGYLKPTTSGTDDVKKVEQLIPLYFGNQQQYAEKLPDKIQSILPDGIDKDFLTHFRTRKCPAFLGNLAEISINPDVTLDELNDITSDEALRSKAEAAKVLAEKLPHKNEKGEWVFDYDGFVNFVHENTDKLRDKLLDVLERGQDTMSIYEKADLVDKYGIQIDGLFDAYNQQFLYEGSVTKEVIYSPEVTSRTYKNQAVSAVAKQARNIVDGVFSRIKFPVNDWNKSIETEPTQVLFGGQPYPSRKIIANSLKACHKEIATEEETMAGIKSGQTVNAPLTSNFLDNITGVFGNLTGFEQMLFGLDPELSNMIIAEPVTDEKNAAIDAKLYFVDKNGKSHDFQIGKDPAEADWKTLIKVKDQLYKVITSERYASNLLPEEVANMKEYLGLATDAQKLAHIQCSGLRNTLIKVTKEMNKNISPDNLPDVEFFKLSKPVTDLKDYVSELITNPNEANYHRFKKQLELANAAIAEYKNHLANHQNAPAEHAEYVKTLETAVNGYQNSFDRIPTVIKDGIDAEKLALGESIVAKNNESAMAKVLEIIPPYNETIDKLMAPTVVKGAGVNLNAEGQKKEADLYVPGQLPEGLTEEAYNAIMIGAFLSDGIVELAELEGVEGEFKTEKVWNEILNNLLLNGEDNLNNAADVIETARMIGEQAVEDYINGDRSAAEEMIKNYANAAVRLQDKNNYLDGLNQEAVLNREMLKNVGEIVSQGNFNNITGVDSVATFKSAIKENIKVHTDFGYNAALDILSNNAKIAEDGNSVVRRSAVLGVLTNMYLRMHAKNEKEELVAKASSDIAEAATRRGINLSQELVNDKSLGDLSSAILKIREATYIDSLEANFVNEESSKHFVENVRSKLEKTKLYELLMKNDKALDEIATKGENASVLNSEHIKSLMDIKYTRTSADLDHTAMDAAIDEEYNRQVDAVWDRYANKIALKQSLLDIVKNEVSQRPALDHTKPLFYQNATRIATLYASKKDELVAMGCDEKLVDELVTMIEAYKKLADEVYDINNPGADKMRSIEKELNAGLDEIVTAYKDLNKDMQVVPADSQLALIASDKKILATAIAQGEKDFNVRTLVDAEIKNYHDDKLLSQFEDVTSREFLADNAKELVASMLEELKNAPADGNAVEEFDNVVKGTEYLYSVIDRISKEGQPELVNGPALASYKEALENLSDKLGKYNDATIYNASSDRKLVVDYINNKTITSLVRVNEAEKADRSIQNSIDKKNPNTVSYEETIKGLIKTSKAFGTNLERKADNFHHIFMPKPENNLQGWVSEFRNKYIEEANNYDPNKMPGYTDKELAAIVGVITFSNTLQNKSINQMAQQTGNTITDTYNERTGASGDKPLAILSEKARFTMNQLMDEIKAGNWDNFTKYFTEGYKMVSSTIGENSFVLTNLNSIASIKVAKEIQDVIDNHPELQNVLNATEKVKEKDGTEVEKPLVPDWVKNHFKSAQKVAPFADIYAESRRRVAEYIEQHMGGQFTLEADSPIARDLMIVKAYEKLDCDITQERCIVYNEAADIATKKAEKSIRELTEAIRRKNQVDYRINFIVKYKLDEQAMENVTPDQYTTIAPLLSAEQITSILKLSPEQVAKLKEDLLKEQAAMEAEIEELQGISTGSVSAVPYFTDVFTKSINEISADDFEMKVQAQKQELFGDAQSKTYSTNEMAMIGLNSGNSAAFSLLKSVIVQSNFRESAIVKAREDVKEFVDHYKATSGNKNINDAIDKYLEKVDYYVERLKKLETPLKDGSYIRVNEELRDSMIKSLDDNEFYKIISDIEKEFKKTNKDQYVDGSHGLTLSKISDVIRSAARADQEALKAGKLYGATEMYNVKSSVDTIKPIADALAKSRRWGDGSSPEFKALLNNLTKINDIETDKRTDAGIKAYVETLQKIYDSAKEYARHKAINNNGKARSILRINEVDKLIKYLDGVLPAIKTEAANDSLENRFKSLGFSKEKIADADKIFENFDNKRSELGKLEDEPYKKVSERAMTARERLMEYYIKGMPKDGFVKGTKEYSEIKKCIAEIILEKRFEYERDVMEGIVVVDEEARSVKPIFYSKLLSRDENDEVFVPGEYQVKLELDKEAIADQEEDNYDELLEDIDAAFDEGDSLFDEADEVEDELEAEENLVNSQASKENVYDNMVNQIMSYNFINDDDLRPENIFKLLSDQSGEVANLYQTSLHSALESKKLADMAKEKAVAELEQKARQAENANGIRL